MCPMVFLSEQHRQNIYPFCLNPNRSPHVEFEVIIAYKLIWREVTSMQVCLVIQYLSKTNSVSDLILTGLRINNSIHQPKCNQHFKSEFEAIKQNLFK